MLDNIITALWCIPMLLLVYRHVHVWRLRREAAVISADVAERIEEALQALAEGKPLPVRDGDEPNYDIVWRPGELGLNGQPGVWWGTRVPRQ